MSLIGGMMLGRNIGGDICYEFYDNINLGDSGVKVVGSRFMGDFLDYLHDDLYEEIGDYGLC